jgi:hypothetical protein
VRGSCIPMKRDYSFKNWPSCIADLIPYAYAEVLITRVLLFELLEK